jgi:hypothetical protein
MVVVCAHAPVGRHVFHGSKGGLGQVRAKELTSKEDLDFVLVSPHLGYERAVYIDIESVKKSRTIENDKRKESRT